MEVEQEQQRKRCITEFYKEEFLRHRSRLESQRSFFAEKTYEEIESVLNKLIDEMDRICEVENFEELASNLLQRIDVVTNLSTSKVNPTYRIH
jgi:U3 small nucleolar ribonucleoprotein component